MTTRAPARVNTTSYNTFQNQTGDSKPLSDPKSKEKIFKQVKLLRKDIQDLTRNSGDARAQQLEERFNATIATLVRTMNEQSLTAAELTNLREVYRSIDKRFNYDVVESQKGRGEIFNTSRATMPRWCQVLNDKKQINEENLYLLKRFAFEGARSLITTQNKTSYLTAMALNVRCVSMEFVKLVNSLVATIRGIVPASLVKKSDRDRAETVRKEAFRVVADIGKKFDDHNEEVMTSLVEMSFNRVSPIYDAYSYAELISVYAADYTVVSKDTELIILPSRVYSDMLNFVAHLFYDFGMIYRETKAKKDEFNPDKAAMPAKKNNYQLPPIALAVANLDAVLGSRDRAALKGLPDQLVKTYTFIYNLYLAKQKSEIKQEVISFSTSVSDKNSGTKTPLEVGVEIINFTTIDPEETPQGMHVSRHLAAFMEWETIDAILTHHDYIMSPGNDMLGRIGLNALIEQDTDRDQIISVLEEYRRALEGMFTFCYVMHAVSCIAHQYREHQVLPDMFTSMNPAIGPAITPLLAPINLVDKNDNPTAAELIKERNAVTQKREAQVAGLIEKCALKHKEYLEAKKKHAASKAGKAVEVDADAAATE